MIVVSISNLTKTFPSLNLFENVSATIKAGDKIGLIGPNGSGKTTLLEMIAGLIEPDAGSLGRAKECRHKYLPQAYSPDPDHGTDTQVRVFDRIKSGFDWLNSLQREIDILATKIAIGEASSGEKNRYGEAVQAFEFHGGYRMEVDIEKVAAGLGFAESDLDKTLAMLSGGERNRSELARILIAQPDLLLLDEPTNHLDISGIEFLESFIMSSPAAAIIVSHDRRFLDRTVARIWEIRARGIRTFPGNYTAFIQTRQKQDELDLKAFIHQQDFIRKTEDFIQKNIAGQKTKQAQSRRKMLAKLKRLEKPPADGKSLSLNFSDAARTERIVCQFENVRFGYDSRLLLDKASFTIERGDRVGLLGKNGSGKTTILELLQGNLMPDAGEITIGQKAEIGYFRQTRTDFNPDDKVIDVIWRFMPELTEGRIRNYLGSFLFSGDDVFRPVKTFSGGQKSRLALAALIAARPNFLILDEPTNHLDIPSCEALENALINYSGTMLVVSHDRFFLDNVTDKILHLDRAEITTYPGGYSYFESRIKLSDISLTPASKASRPAVAKTRSRRTNPIIINKLRDEIEGLETELGQVYDAIEADENMSDWSRLQELYDAKTNLEGRLLTMYEKLDSLTADD